LEGFGGIKQVTNNHLTGSDNPFRLDPVSLLQSSRIHSALESEMVVVLTGEREKRCKLFAGSPNRTFSPAHRAPSVDLRGAIGTLTPRGDGEFATSVLKVLARGQLSHLACGALA